MKAIPFLLFCLTLLGSSLLWNPGEIARAASQLTPDEVVVQGERILSDLNLGVEPPPYEPLPPKEGGRFFRPDFRLSDYEFPKDFPSTREVHWFTRFAGTFASLFRGSVGQMEMGILAYEKDEHQAAQAAFTQVLAKGSPQLKEEARLWQSWSLYRSESWQTAQESTLVLSLSEDPALVQEAWRLRLMLAIRTEDLGELSQSLKALPKAVAPASWSIDLHYAALAGHLELGQDQEARRLLESFLKRGIHHSRLYVKALEIQGLLAYRAENFSEALESLTQAKRIDLRGESQSRFYRHIAWLHYLQKEPKRLTSFLDEEIAVGPEENKAELQYLKAMLLIEEREPEKLLTLLQSMDRQSPFFNHASGATRFHLSKLQAPAELAELVQSQDILLPSERFRVYLLDCYKAAKKKQVFEAREHCAKALAEEGQEGRWIALYNLATMHLYMEEFNQAGKLFAKLRFMEEAEAKEEILAGLLYALYRQDDLEHFQEAHAKPLKNPKEQWRALLMKGAMKYHRHQYGQAAESFSMAWSIQKDDLSLGLKAQSLYNAGDYQTAADLPNLKDLRLSEYRSRSLLALKKPARALAELLELKYHAPELLELHLNLLLVNQRFADIERRILEALPHVESEPRRYHLLTKLGDAYYNLKDYKNAKETYYESIHLAPGAKERSLSIYYRALALNAMGPFSTFEEVAKQNLEEPTLTEEVRYRLTQLLVDGYLAQERFQDADWMLYKYVKEQDHKRIHTHVKRVQLHLDQQNFQKCMLLAAQPLRGLDHFQRRDLAILNATCSIKQGETIESLAILQDELKQNGEDYRKDELELLLAEAMLLGGKEAEAKELMTRLDERPLNEEARLLLGLLELKTDAERVEPAQLLERLGDINRYRNLKRYHEALELRIQLQVKAGRSGQAIKDLLRMLYRSATPKQEKPGILLELARLHLDRKELKEALDYFGQIDPETVPKGRWKLYLSLSKRLEAAKAQPEG